MLFDVLQIMKTLDALCSRLLDLPHDVVVTNREGTLVWTTSEGMQVNAVEDSTGEVTVTYEEAPHVAHSVICSLAQAELLVRKALSRDSLCRLTAG